MAERAGDLTPATAARYRCSLAQLAPFLEPLFLDEIDREKIDELVAARLGAPIGDPARKRPSAGTIRRDLTALSAVLGAAVAWGWHYDNPARYWDRSALPERREPIVLPRARDIDRVAALAPRTIGLMMRLAQHTGMREAEIVRLDWRQVDMERATINLRRLGPGRVRAASKMTPRERGRVRVMKLDPRALAALQSAAPHFGSGLVFGHSASEPYRSFAGNFARVVRRVAAAAKREGADFRPFKFQDLRHVFAVGFLRRGGNLFALQRALGHASVKSTERYLDFLTPRETASAQGEMDDE
ncbi:MAG: tyrosine-type recombinase/integrase [Alphaproteobacteria bacterium]